MERGPEKSAESIQKNSASFESLTQTIPDLIRFIFSSLPQKQWLAQRRLSKRIRHILDMSLLNPRVSPLHVDDELKANNLFNAQQAEIACLQENKSTILKTPKFETAMVRPDQELLTAFAELEKLPKHCTLFTLYQPKNISLFLRSARNFRPHLSFIRVYGKQLQRY